MQHLFSPQGELALRLALQCAPLLAFDFDGTLTPIVPRPDDACLTPAVSARLATLAAHCPVAIITGRSVIDVRPRLGFQPRFIVGNHGAEIEDLEDPHPAPPKRADALTRLRQHLHASNPALQAAGVWVEDKGLSLALHYRNSRGRERAQQLIMELLAGLDDELRVFGGKLVINVAQRQAPDKADAVRTLIRRCGVNGAIFAGDDVNDEPVFASAPEQWLTIRVGRDDAGTAAKYFLEDPGEVSHLLERMVMQLEER